ncbi:MAG: MATE family efflux transporter [Tissierellia bacterium]|nr:MATE family efflux transporter [Tissierellia bacterium]
MEKIDRKDLTQGTPWKRILAFSFPLLLGNLAQQLYNTVDSIVVGKYVGDNALAAVGASGPLLNFLIIFFVGISTGINIMVSQYFGGKKKEDLEKSIGTAIILTALSSAFLMILAPLVIPPFLKLINTPAEILDWAQSYLSILMYGVAGLAYFNILSGILRGLGDSLSSLYYLLTSTIINIVLDLLFVIKFDMGVSGVALATIIAQGVSALLAFIKLMSFKDIFDLNKSSFKLYGHYVYQMLKLGLPSGATQGIFSLAMLLVQSLSNKFGPNFIAANLMVMRVDGLAMLPNFSFGFAMTTFTGQNIGAGKIDRVIRGTKEGTILALISSISLTAIILLFGHQLMMLFTQTSELADYALRLMYIIAPGYIFFSITQSLGGVMRGAGDTITPMWISISITLGVRVPLAYGLSYLTRGPGYPVGRPESIFVSLLVTWILGALLTLFFYRKGNWKNKVLYEGSPS